MNYFFWLVIGLIAGWLIEWVIDWIFWRRDDQSLQKELAEAQTEKHQLEEKLERLRNQLKDAEDTIAQLRAAPVASTVSKIPDRLEKIHGIGAVFARRLNEAGIHTFAELAQLTPNQIRDIVAVDEWQKIEPEAWIAEAQQLVDQQRDPV